MSGMARRIKDELEEDVEIAESTLYAGVEAILAAQDDEQDDPPEEEEAPPTPDLPPSDGVTYRRLPNGALVPED